jgi:hypothetical protein
MGCQEDQPGDRSQLEQRSSGVNTKDLNIHNNQKIASASALHQMNGPLVSRIASTI